MFVVLDTPEDASKFGSGRGDDAHVGCGWNNSTYAYPGVEVRYVPPAHDFRAVHGGVGGCTGGKLTEKYQVAASRAWENSIPISDLDPLTICTLQEELPNIIGVNGTSRAAAYCSPKALRLLKAHFKLLPRRRVRHNLRM